MSLLHQSPFSDTEEETSVFLPLVKWQQMSFTSAVMIVWLFDTLYVKERLKEALIILIIH